MPVFNCEEYIFFAIHSMLRQTYSDFELIVINDASTDGTINILNSIYDARIRILNLKKNSGIVSALNAGLDISRGEFIARMDADDISQPERLAAQVQYLENHTEVGLVGSWIRCFGNGIQTFTHRYPLANDEIKCYLLFENPFAHSTVLFRKSLIDKHQLKYDPDYQYVEDWKLWAQMKRHTKFANLPVALVKYRVNEKSDKYREFQNTQKQKVITKNCFDVNFPYTAFNFDMPNKNREALIECAGYLYELRRANLDCQSFKLRVFEGELSRLWVRSCLSLGKIGLLYSFYYNKKYHLNISSIDIFLNLARILKFRFLDKVISKFDNLMRY
jgi:glycosyltransferase involved in cell wall biosynthesis